jgi:glycosyltransferase involved in cell wall biosynthesis
MLQRRVILLVWIPGNRDLGAPFSSRRVNSSNQGITELLKSELKSALIVSYYFPPAGGAGVQRVAKHVKNLAKFSYQPIVISATPSDYDGPSELSMPIDKSLEAGVPKNVEVYRVRSRQPFGLFRFLRKFRLEYLRELFFVPDSAIFWIRPVVSLGVEIAATKPIDVIYTSVKPHSVAFIGWLLKRRLRKPWVIDFRDPWTQYFLAEFPTKLHYRLEQMLERFILRRADHIITITPGARDQLLEWCEFLSPDKVSVITNGYDEEEFGEGSSSPGAGVGEFASKNGHFSIVYSGVFCGAPISSAQNESRIEGTWRAMRRRFAFAPRNFERIAHSPKFLLDALSELFKERPELRGRIRLIHVGPFDESNRAYVRQLGIPETIVAKGYVSHDDAVRLVREADSLFLCLADSPSGERNDCVPQKVYEYLGSRRPILALVPDGDARDFLKQGGTALVCNPRDLGQIKRGVLSLLELHDKREQLQSNDEFIRRFRRAELTKELAAIFDSVIANEDQAPT